MLYGVYTVECMCCACVQYRTCIYLYEDPEIWSRSEYTHGRTYSSFFSHELRYILVYWLLCPFSIARLRTARDHELLPHTVLFICPTYFRPSSHSSSTVKRISEQSLPAFGVFRPEETPDTSLSICCMLNDVDE